MSTKGCQLYFKIPSSDAVESSGMSGPSRMGLDAACIRTSSLEDK